MNKIFVIVIVIIKKFDVHPLKSLQDIKQNLWTMKYRSCRPIFIFLSKVGSHCHIICMYDTHSSISLQDIIRKNTKLRNIDQVL